MRIRTPGSMVLVGGPVALLLAASASPAAAWWRGRVFVEPKQAWYYCQDPKGYYPYVQQCPRGWQTVSPTPAPAQ